MSKAFDPEQTARMTRALLRAFAELAAREPMTERAEAQAKALLAQGVVTAAQSGELDEDRLVAGALAYHAAERERMSEPPVPPA